MKQCQECIKGYVKIDLEIYIDNDKVVNIHSTQCNKCYQNSNIQKLLLEVVAEEK